MPTAFNHVLIEMINIDKILHSIFLGFKLFCIMIIEKLSRNIDPGHATGVTEDERRD